MKRALLAAVALVALSSAAMAQSNQSYQQQYPTQGDTYQGPAGNVNAPASPVGP